MASDQRYCVICGDRRGEPRFSTESLSTPRTAPASPPSRPPRSARWGGASALIAGVGTLLLAMGVGVLIGHNSNSNSPTRAAAPQVITVGGGPSGSTTAANAAQAPKAKKSKPSVVHISPKVSKAASSAASKVLGASAPKKPTITPGESCTNGTAGCTNGKFTGDFFGGQ
jgi:hypothetical protein